MQNAILCRRCYVKGSVMQSHRDGALINSVIVKVVFLIYLYPLDSLCHLRVVWLQKYIDTIRQGQGENPKQYSARYVCSLVADFHRTLLQGGWCANPRAHLRLVYEGNPLSMLAEQV